MGQDYFFVGKSARERIAFDEKTLAIMQRGHGNRAQGSVRDDDQGLDAILSKLPLQRTDQNIKQPPGGLQITVAEGFKLTAQGTHLCGERFAVYLNGELLDPIGKREQELHARREQDGIEHRGLGWGLIQASDPRLVVGHAIVLKIILQLGVFQRLQRIARFDKLCLY